MKKFVILPLVLATALGVSACSKTSETENVTVNETSTNVETPLVDENASVNATDGALEDAGNASNASDTLTNG